MPGNVSIVLMSYGSPNGLTSTEEYLSDIMRGRRPSREQVDSLEAKYLRIGRSSPLQKITEAQARELQRVLSEDGSAAHVTFGFKHARPRIKDAVLHAIDNGAESVIGIAMAPHYSVIGTAEYGAELEEAAREKGARYVMVKEWYSSKAFTSMWVDLIRAAAESAPRFSIVFTAHSIPKSAGSEWETYARQVTESARAVSSELGTDAYRVAFQSGRGGWLGPSLQDTMESIQGQERIVIAPIGYAADNLETLYDIDVEIREDCDAKGIEMVRTEMPNYSHKLVEVVKGACEAAMGGLVESK